MRYVSAIAAIIISPLAFIPLYLIAQPKGEPVVIGATVTLTGPTAIWGTTTQRAMAMATKEINAAGGIRGRPLEVRFEDFGYADLKRAATGANKLINIDEVSVILTQWSEDTEVVYPIAAKRNTITLTFGAGSRHVTKDKPLLFRIWPGHDALIEDTLGYAFDRGVRKMCTVVEQSAFFVSMSSVADETWKTLNGANPDKSEYVVDTVDPKAVLFGLRNCEAVLFLAGQNHIGPFLKQMRVMKLSPLRLGYDSMEEQEVLDSSGQAANGTVYSKFVRFTPEFVQKFTTAYGEEPKHPAGSAYDSVKLLAHVMNSTGTDTASLRKGLLEVRNFPGASGSITLTNERDRMPPAIVRMVIEGGKPVPLVE